MKQYNQELYKSLILKIHYEDDITLSQNELLLKIEAPIVAD